MPMTSENMTTPPEKTTLSASAQQVKDAVAKLRSDEAQKEAVLRAAAQSAASTQGKDAIEDLLADTKAEFEDQVKQEVKASQVKAEEKINSQGTNLKDLTEDDAYDLSVDIMAPALHSPNFLKIVLKDCNYVARWGNTNSIRQGQLVAQGFKKVTKDEVANLETLEMHLDSRGHFVWADLVALKIPKDIYYAGLRRAYVKSLHATNAKKAAEAGALFAKTNLTASLSVADRNYMQQHEAQNSNKPIYNPTVGV